MRSGWRVPTDPHPTLSHRERAFRASCRPVRLASGGAGQLFEECRDAVAAHFVAGLVVGGHPVELDDVAAADELLVAVPGCVAVGEDEEGAVHGGDFDGVVVDVVGAAEEAEAAVLAGPFGGFGVEVEEDGDALCGAVDVDAAVFFAGLAAEGDHCGGVFEVEGEFAGDGGAEAGALEFVHEGFGLGAEAEAFGWEGAAFLDAGEVRDDAGEDVRGDEVLDDDVFEGVVGDRGFGQAGIIEREHGVL